MDGAAEVEEWRVGDRFVKDDKDAVHGLLKLGEFVANSFVDAATDAVATDGRFEDFFGNNNSKALVAASIRRKNQ